MNFGVNALGWLLVVFSCSSSCPAVTADNPYHTIVDRNPFSLNPPPPLQTNSSVEPPKNIKFNGITRVGGRTKAFFTIPGKEAKDPPLYVTLSEAERADVLEVTKIFKDEGEVEVVNSGIKMVLNFKNNGNKGVGGVQVASGPVPVPALSVPQNPSAVPAVYSPTFANPVIAASSPVVAGSAVVHSDGNASFANTPIYNGGYGSRQPMQNSSGAYAAQNIDLVQQRMNMLAQDAAITSAFDGPPKTVNRPSTDPKIGGYVSRHLANPPAPPLPPSPPSLSAATGE